MASGALLPNTTERKPAQNKRENKVYNLLPKLILPCYLFKEGENNFRKNVKTAEQDRFFLYLHHCL